MDDVVRVVAGVPFVPESDVSFARVQRTGMAHAHTSYITRELQDIN